MESHSGANTPVATNLNPKLGRGSKVPPELRALLRQAMRDGSDWHPQLHDTVAQITGMKTSKCVRTRVYVTSASTMHSLLNVLAFGDEVSDEDPIDRSKVADVTDLHYLSHFVIRCFEEPETTGGAETFQALPKRILGRTVSTTNEEAKKYTVEVLFSPGVLCKELRENAMCMAPLQSIGKRSACSLDGFDTFLTDILAEFGKLDVVGVNQPVLTAPSPKSM